ncbi:Bacteriophage CI repressor helix-turn-helix domain [Candidatus Ornithobacterium hominis]|uniref:LexA family transcriptional regulator n=1 Tax=Candidatus Ornithobacterium hominis TaxID=2497989 RepID=UPI000E5A9DAB|nr:S24 family peptidase [Candidatus Ornithobacterium hominis]SZD72780.1 Bacteriophage CI repressor helix-turn-helix domain [Candidatus Ornithobacterium hominis]
MDRSLILNEIKSYLKIDTDTEFAKYLDVKPQVLSNWRKRNTFDIDLIYTKCENIDANWLLTGKGSMLKQELKLIGNQKSADAVMGIQDIPLYDLEATAGLVEMFRSEKTTSVLNSIRIPGIPKCDGGLSITGDSMYPLLKSGDIVLYKEIPVEQQSIFFGEMYLLGVRVDEWEEMITVKYVQKSDKGEEYVRLASQNQYHHPKDVLLSDITAMAIIKASIRFNTMF